MLLKNEKNLLPLNANNGLKVALIGAQAKAPTVHGGGSGQVVPYYTSAPFDAIRAKLGLPPPQPAKNNCSDGNFETGVDFRNQVRRALHPGDSPGEMTRGDAR